MSDPTMQDTLTQLRSQIDGMNNMDGIFEVGRQLVTQMRTQNPQMFEGVAQSLASEHNPNPDNDPQPPPPTS